MNSYRNKRRYDSSSEESDAEELDSFYNDLEDFNYTNSFDEQEDEDPLGPDEELNSDFDDDPLGDKEKCHLDFDFNDPVEAEEYNFDESDYGDNSFDDFESESESDTDAEDSDDADENGATGSKGKTAFFKFLMNCFSETCCCYFVGLLLLRRILLLLDSNVSDLSFCF